MTAVELGMGSFWLVVAAGIVSGAISWWVFRQFSERQALREAVNRIVAHLFELRLFASEPLLVIRSQRDLLIANARLFRQTLRPTLALLVPLTILFLVMDAIFSRAPLQPGRAAIVTLECDRLRGDHPGQVKLAVPAGIAIETLPVHMAVPGQIAWRVRPLRFAEGKLRLTYAGRTIAKRISSVRRLQWLGNGWNDPISVQYPPATVLGLNWLVWYVAASLGGALLATAISHRASYL